MAIIKCKMCGGDVTLSADKTFGTCEYCGSTMTFPKISDEQLAARFNRGNEFRRRGEFDKALAVYESIVREEDENAEAHWCCALCRFGIEYVEDPTTFEYIPTCHRASFDSFLEDMDYLAAVKYSDGVTKRQYQRDAMKIAEVQKGILATSQNEEPFDVFICYKETDDNGERTRDSLMAQDVYYQLTEAGYRVFFSRITLEDKAGREYEPYIFAALNSAKVMVAIGTKPEHFNAVWVKNEWSRFLAFMRKDRSKLLLPCYKDMDPYDLPEQLSVLQSYDMAKIGFIQDLIRGIKKVIRKNENKPKETVIVQHPDGGFNAETTALLERGYMALEDGEWDKANEFFEQTLNRDAKNAEAYLGKALAACKYSDLNAVKKALNKAFFELPDAKKAKRFGNEKLITEIENAEIAINEEAKLEAQRKAEEIRPLIKRSDKAAKFIATGNCHTVGLKSNGTVVATKYVATKYMGNYYSGECDVSGWKNIIALAAGGYYTVGLKADGTVVATKYIGDYYSGQCDVSGWRNIIAVAAGGHHTVGLKSDGTVVAVGDNSYGQCNVSSWKDIIAVSAGWEHTVGLKSDGTVVAVGDNSSGRCDVSGWKDIIAVSAGWEHTVGLKSDGTVVAVGWNKYGQCDVNGWENIIAVAAGEYHTVGLKSDGTVVATKIIESEYVHDKGQTNVSGWKDIIAVAAGDDHTVGLKSDGTVVATKYIKYMGNYYRGQCDVSGWKLFNDFSHIEEEQKIKMPEGEHRVEELKKKRREMGVCQYCGGNFKGLFTKKCSVCGREKDYDY